MALLGRGGMGAVYKAEHLLMKRTVALKVMSPDVMVTPAIAHQFQHEMVAAARLSHGNIVVAFDADKAATSTFW